MKISEKHNHRIGIKILVSLPLIVILYVLILQYNAIGTLSVSLQEPHDLKTVIDEWIPFVSWFIIPYVLWMLFPIASLIFAFRKNITAINMVALYTAQILLVLSCFIIYLAFPTSAGSVMIDLTQEEQTVNINGIQTLYSNGVPYNAFPSYHVAPVVFIALFLFYKWKRLFWIHLPLAITITIATVFIKYHFFVDILGGIVMGFFAYYILYKKIATPFTNKAFQFS